MFGFKDNLQGSMNFIKRRFSSTDIPADVEQDPPSNVPNHLPQALPGQAPQQQQPGSQGGVPPAANRPTQQAFVPPSASNVANFMSSLTGAARTKGPSPSAPSSPSRTMSMTSVQGFTSGVTGITKGLFSQRGREHCKNLLVLDEPHTDWTKYFRGKKLSGDWDIRVEQAELSEVSLVSSAESGATVDITPRKSGSKVIRGFRPDFVLVRQHVRNADYDFRNVIIGLQYAGVPSVNTLHSVYNFQDKPWVHAQLLAIQHRIGADAFPLINQVYYFNCREPISSDKLPSVVKVGHAFCGIGKVRVEDQLTLTDATSILPLSQSYCTTEPFIDAKYDVHIQKIGSNYKAFMRKSISGNWKTNLGSAMLEQISMNDRFKMWVDECSRMFGWLDIVEVQAIHSKEGRDFIVEVNDSSMNLLGETQEDDRRAIASLVLQRMQQHCVPTPQPTSNQPHPAPSVTTPGSTVSSSHPQQLASQAPQSTVPVQSIQQQVPRPVQTQVRGPQAVPTNPQQAVPPHPPTAPPPPHPQGSQPSRPSSRPTPVSAKPSSARQGSLDRQANLVQQPPSLPRPLQPQPAPPPHPPQPNRPPQPALANVVTASAMMSGAGSRAASVPNAPAAGLPPSASGTSSPAPSLGSPSASSSGGGPVRSTSSSSQVNSPRQPPIPQPPTHNPGAVEGNKPPNSTTQVPGEPGTNVEGEDTMKNLRKTFAGIFGDM